MDILVVDDDEVDRESVKRSLLKSDFACNILEANCAAQALELCGLQNFDVILLDYRLPDRDGIELLHELHNAAGELGRVVVMMSNSEDENVALDALHAGAQDFILKREISTARLRRVILQARKRFELEQALRDSFQRVKLLAERDMLTKLANRYLFDETFKIAVNNNVRYHSTLALLVFDLDNFKLINDTYGHSMGDQLLKRVCRRVMSTLRGSELFARLGGDEFALLLTNLGSVYDAARVAERICTCMKLPFDMDGHELSTSVSIGISVSTGNDYTAEELLKYADIAMYRSKRSGRGKISFFEQGMQEQTQRRLLLENGLIQSLANGDFRLAYQPLLDAQDGSTFGFEALLRWSFNGEQIAPIEFIAIAEEAHLMVDLGRWVIAEGIAQLASWNQNRTQPFHLAINISAVQLGDVSLVDFIRRECAHHQVSPKLLEFEITETALIDNVVSRSQLLNDIHTLGCRLALDDFGTGYSSIAHLQNFPLDTVKLDKTLMTDARGGEKSRALITGLTQMIKALNLELVAEGVETRAQADLCRALGVNRLQGFYFSFPLSSEDVTQHYG